MKTFDKVTVTLFFEGAVHLVKTRDAKPTKLEATDLFKGSNEYSVDVDITRNVCKVDILLDKYQINNYPSDSSIKSIGLNRRVKNFPSRWKSISDELKATLHAQDFMHDRGASSFKITMPNE